MKRCFNTCQFLETFIYHALYLESELMGQGGCVVEVHPCITKEAKTVYLKLKKGLHNINTQNNGPCTRFHLSRQVPSLFHVLKL